MFGWLKKLFGKNEDESLGVSRCSVHPQVGTTNPDRAIYYAVDEYTNSGYIQLAEDMSKLDFLTIIGQNPLTFQIGTSNVIISPDRDGSGIIFYEAIVVSRPRSFSDPSGFLRFERHGTRTFEEAFELLKDEDQESVIYALDILGNLDVSD